LVNGNTANIRDSIKKRLEALYEMRQPRDAFLDEALAFELIEISHAIKREIAVLDVSVGDAATVAFPRLSTLRRETRLSGVRCIHTHPRGSEELSGIDLHTLRTSRLDAMCAIGIDAKGKFTGLQAAVLTPDGKEAEVCDVDTLDALPLYELMRRIREVDDAMVRADAPIAEAPEKERAVLLGRAGQNGGRGGGLY